VFSKFLWKLRLGRAVSGGGPSFADAALGCFREASVEVIKTSGFVGKRLVGDGGCGLGMLIVRPRDALSLLLGR
jgi:hypothetical protein